MMKRTLTLGILLALPLASPMADEIEQRSAESREVIGAFFSDLKIQLVTALADGGAVKATMICRDKAPEIAKQHSEARGWKVARTSLKTRNTKNAPDAWEKTVLEGFEKRKAAGEDVNKMEQAEIVEMDGKKVFRYMKAIPTAEKPCLMCHGDDVQGELAEILS